MFPHQVAVFFRLQEGDEVDAAPHFFAGEFAGEGVSVWSMRFGLGLWVEDGRWALKGNNDEEVGDWETQGAQLGVEAGWRTEGVGV